MTQSVRCRFLGLAIPVSLAIALAACGSQAGTSRTSASPSAGDLAGARANRADRANQSVPGAAEPFEAVTEQAFTARWGHLDSLISQADVAVRAVKPNLPGETAANVDRQLSDLRSARTAHDRAGIAMAALEAYRALVQAQDPGGAAPPIAVSLLDYAGFRYDALAQSRNPDWPEMVRQTEFAGEQWRQLASKVHSRALPGVMESALRAMTSAAERKDVESARRSAAVELALVDLLEEQLVSQPLRPSESNR